jgi:hypothetical protein
MNHFPRMMAFQDINFSIERDSMNDFEDVNAILSEMVDEGMVEPIDDPSIQTDFYDWAEVVGISGEIEPDIEWA